jgi:S-DNA-T family DNA segregation ATPase FtsK/SpoIIIE
MDALLREDTHHSSADALLQIRVVAGAGAGTVYSVGAGKLSLGSDPECTFVLGGSEVPGIAALIEIDGGGTAVVRRAHVEAEPHLNGQNIEQAVEWAAGATLRVHEVVFETGPPDTLHASLRPSNEPGRLDYNRPPRLFPPQRQTTFRLPALPTEEARRSLPVLMAWRSWHYR